MAELRPTKITITVMSFDFCMVPKYYLAIPMDSPLYTPGSF